MSTETNQAMSALKSLKEMQMTDQERKDKLARLNNITVSEPEIDGSEAEIKAKAVVEKLLSFDLKNPEVQEGVVLALKRENEGVMEKAQSFTSDKLQARMGDLKGSDEGNVVYDNMMQLNDTLKQIHPSNFDMTENFLTKRIPFLSKVRRYFDQFQSTQSIMSGMKERVKEGIESQKTDIKILKVDKNGLAKMAIEIKTALEFNNAILKGVQAAKEEATDLEVVEFLEAQVEFNIVREIQGLQELLTVNMQGQQSFEMLIRSGGDLIDAAERCVNVSMNALMIAAVIQHVVTGQRKLMGAVKAINETTDFMISHNAKMTATTVAEIGRMAVETSLNVDTLINAIDMSAKAIQDDIQFRRDSLPNMKNNIDRLQEANKKAEAETSKLTKGREIKESYSEEASKLFSI
jgi:uncharacterized protein YaaN involved in tellurite resistance